MRGSALSEYRSSEKPREGAGLRKFLEQGCDARPEDRHHAMQDLDQLERELSDWRDRANRVIKERDRLAVSATAPLEVLDRCLSELANKYMNTVEDYYLHGLWRAREEIAKLRRAESRTKP
jgi:hypothetical protein